MATRRGAINLKGEHTEVQSKAFSSGKTLS